MQKSRTKVLILTKDDAVHLRDLLGTCWHIERIVGSGYGVFVSILGKRCFICREVFGKVFGKE